MKYRKIASKKTEIITEQPERKNYRRKPGFYGRYDYYAPAKIPTAV